MPNILLVDDVELFLELEKSLLEDLDYDLSTARSGEEVLERIDTIKPDLILLDLYMGGLDGDEVCRRLRAIERWANLPIIMVTAAGRREEVERCLQSGCDDYVTKPVSKAELVEKVQRLLGEVKSRRAPREAVGLQVYLESDSWSGTVWARDISSNGIYIESVTDVPIGTLVKITIDLPGAPARLIGKVARIVSDDESGFGVYIVHQESAGVAVEPTLPAVSVEIDNGAVDIRDERLKRLQAENERLTTDSDQLRQQIRELEEENLDFANQIVRTEEINNNLTNLYIASSRLHSVLDRALVAEIIKEITINFVGAEKFALLLYKKGSDKLDYVMGEGFDDDEFPATIPVNKNEIFTQAVEEQESFFVEGSVVQGSDDPFRPLAAIPLVIHGDLIGMLTIYRLLVQKDKFEAIDFHLFSMMAEHAATALFSSGLYEKSERKRETYRSMMDLLLK
jgi:CheY-like chemotaxis protein